MRVGELEMICCWGHYSKVDGGVAKAVVEW